MPDLLNPVPAVSIFPLTSGISLVNATVPLLSGKIIVLLSVEVLFSIVVE